MWSHHPFPGTRRAQSLGSVLLVGLALAGSAAAQGTLDDLEVRLHEFEKQVRDLPQGELETRLGALQSGLVAALAGSDRERAADLLGELGREVGWTDDRAPAELLTMVRNSAEPVALAARIVGPCTEGEFFQPEPLRAALEARPDHPGLLACLALSFNDPAWRLAFFERALASGAELPDASRAALASETLWQMASLGFARDMTALVDRLPESVRRLVLRPSTDETFDLSGVRVVLPARSLQLDLEAARRLAGQPPGPIPSGTPKRAPTKEGEEPPPVAPRPATLLQQELLERLAQAPDDDPFDFVVAWLLKTGDWDDDSDQLSGCLWSPLFSRYASEQGYESAARAAVASCRRLPHDYPSDGPWVGAENARLSPDLRALLDGVVQRQRDTVAALPEAAREDAPSNLGRRVIPLPDPSWPREVDLRETPPPPADPWAACPETGSRDSIRGWLPRGFGIVRCEASGPNRIVVALSQRYDPAGEVTPGGYWILRSADAGARWTRLYTGLHAFRPYVVPSSSTVPMVRADGLLLEVSMREIDDSTVTFPPVMTGLKRERSGLALELPWSELERDRDGDGLTDLTEAALFTDPDDPDTDSDGVGDAGDPLPGVPFSATGAPAAEALAAVLSGLGLARMPPIPEPPQVSSDGRGAGPLGQVPVADDTSTLFVVGDPADWSAVRSAARVVVTTPEERDRIVSLRGSFYPVSIKTFFLDRAGRRGFAVIDESWRGETFYLELKDGAWKAVSVASWIS
jgi:hypothetical protein